MEKFDLGTALEQMAEDDPLSVIPKDTPREQLFEVLKPILTGLVNEPELSREDSLARIEKYFELNKQESKALRADFKALAHENKDPKLTQADILIDLAQTTTLFRNDLQETFAKIEVNHHNEIWPVKSVFFRRWLIGRYYAVTGKAPNAESITQALGVIDARACFDHQEEYKLHLRVAEHDGAFWYDLADEQWRAIKITPEGWEIVNNPPILFRRYKNTAPQIEPELVNNGILPLLKFINAGGSGNTGNSFDTLTEEQILFLVHTIACLIPNIPHPVSNANGEKGAAKSTFQRVTRKVIDPARRELLTLPNDKNELALTLNTNYMPAFDNIDDLQPWQSDMLCCAVTGGGISKRALFTDEDEIILSFLRCPALNGINMIATRPDLLDRTLIFTMERISEEMRKEEADFWTAFEEARPGILGSMFDALAGAMRIYPTVKLPRLPRMADFCRWGYAIAEVLGIGGDRFLSAYEGNRGRANDEAINSSPVAAAIVALMDDKMQWNGTAGELWDKLQGVATDERINVKAKSWPKAANALTKRLNRVKSNLLDVGILYRAYRDSSTNKSMVSLLINTHKTSGTSGTSDSQERRPVTPGDNDNDTSGTSGEPPGMKVNNDAGYGDTGDTGGNFAHSGAEKEKHTSGGCDHYQTTGGCRAAREIELMTFERLVDDEPFEIQEVVTNDLRSVDLFDR